MSKLFSLSVLILNLLLMQSCASVATETSLQATKSNTLSGHYIYGHEVNTFQPCGEKRVVWVQGTEDILSYLEQEYLRFSTKPYEEVFLQIEGHYMARASDGFAADFEGQINVKKVIQVASLSDSECSSL